MIDRQVIRHRFGMEEDRLTALCHLLWNKNIYLFDHQKAAVLGSGLLVYRYAAAEQAVLTLRKLDRLIGQELQTLSVVNGKWAAYGGRCWAIDCHADFSADDPHLGAVLGPVIESHALDLRQLVLSLDESPAPSAAGAGPAPGAEEHP